MPAAVRLCTFEAFRSHRLESWPCTRRSCTNSVTRRLHASQRPCVCTLPSARTQYTLVGQQYTFLEERGENAFHLVLPTRAAPADSQSSVGASEVNFHTEDPIRPLGQFQPTALALLMIRASPGAQTALVTLDDLAEELLAAPALLRTLGAPRFKHPAPDVVRIMGGRRAAEAEAAYAPLSGAPVLYVREREGAPPTAAIVLTETPDAIVAHDDEARDAIVALRSMLLRRAARYSLAPGEMLLWANQRAAHGRTGRMPTPRYDGFDRLLLRSFHHPKPPARVVREYTL